MNTSNTNELIDIFADTNLATLHTEMKYTIIVRNIFNTTLNQLSIPLHIPNSTKYKDASLVINNTVQSLPNNGIILISSLGINELYKIEYSVIVTNVSSTGKIINYSSIENLDSTSSVKTFSKILTENIVTMVKGVDINYNTTLNKDIFYPNDLLECRIVIQNLGNIKALNSNLRMSIPSNLQIDKLFINDLPVSLKLDNLPLGNLSPFEALNVKFTALVKSEIFNNDSIIVETLYDYYDDYLDKLIYNCKQSTLVNLNYNFVVISPLTTNFALYVENESIFLDRPTKGRYSIVNKGNIPLENIVLKIDITDSIFIKNIMISKSYLLQKDNYIHIHHLDPGDSLEISFDILLKDLLLEQNIISIKMDYTYYNLDKEESINCRYLSNTIKLKSYGVLLTGEKDETLKKLNSKKIYKSDEVIDFTIRFTNNSNLSFSKIIFKEKKTELYDFVSSSFKLNNKTMLGADIVDGVVLNNFDRSNDIELYYEIKVKSDTKLDKLITFSYLDIISMDEGYKKSYEIISDTIDIISPELYQSNASNIISEYTIDDSITYYNTISNNGNVTLYDINFDIVFPKILNNGTFLVEDVSNNSLRLPYLEPNDTKTIKFIANIDSSIQKHLNTDYFFDIVGSVDYSYKYPTPDNYESSNLILDSCKYKILNPSVEYSISTKENLYLHSDEIIVNILIKNIGNCSISNLSLSKFKDYSAYNSDNILEFLSIARLPEILSINESINLEVALDKSEINKSNEISLYNNLSFEYIKNGELIKSITPSNIYKFDVIQDNFLVDIHSNKSKYLIDDMATFNVKISNIGNSSFDKCILKLDIPESMKPTNDTFKIKNKQYLYKDIINGIPIDDIKSFENLVFSLSFTFNEKAIYKKDKFFLSIDGSYKSNSSSSIIKKSIQSNEIILDVCKINLESFISTDKEILLNGDTVTFTSTLINTSTIPLKVKYKILVSNELQENLALAKVNGDIIEDNEYIITIDCNDGAIFENTFEYIQYKGIDSVYSNGCIEILDLPSDLQCKSKYNTDTVSLKVTNTTFTEIYVEETLCKLSHNPDIHEIVNIYANCNIFDYSVTPLYRSYKFSKKELTGYRLDFIGELNYSIEYLSKVYDNDTFNENPLIDDLIDTEATVFIFNVKTYFNSSINLPNSFTLGEDIQITSTILDIHSKLLNESNIFVLANILVNTNL